MNRTYVTGAVLAFIVLAGLIAFSSVSLGPATSPNETSPTQPAASQMPTQAPPVTGSIGDRVEAEGVAITVTGIEWKDSTAGGSAQGNQYLLVHIVAENTNPTYDLQVSAGDFSIKRPNGQTLDFSPDNIASDQLVDMTLKPGQKETRTVVFRLPQSQETLHLLYDYNDQHLDIDMGQ